MHRPASLAKLQRYIVQSFALIGLVFGTFAYLLVSLEIDIVQTSLAPPSSIYLALLGPILIYFAFSPDRETASPEQQNLRNALIIGAVIFFGTIADPLPGETLATIFPVFLAATLIALQGKLRVLVVGVILLAFPVYAVLHFSKSTEFELAIRGLASSLVILVVVELWLRHPFEITARRGRVLGIAMLLIASCPLGLFFFNVYANKPNALLAADNAIGFFAMLTTGILALWRSQMPDGLRWGLAGFTLVGFTSSLIMTGDYSLPVANIVIAICFVLLDRIDAAIAGLVAMATLLVFTALEIGVPTNYALRSMLFSSLLILLLYRLSLACDIRQDLTRAKSIKSDKKLFTIRFLQFVLPTLSLLSLVLAAIELHLHGLGLSFTLTGVLQPVLYIPLLLGLPFICSSGWLFARGAVHEQVLANQSAELERQIATANLAMDVARLGLLEYDMDTGETRHLAGSKALFKDRAWRSIDDYFDRLGVDHNVRVEILKVFITPGLPIDYKIATPAGEEQWIRITASASYEQDGRHLQRLVWSNITREIKTKQKLELNFHEAQFLVERLEKQQERERRMFAVIGHELRTPAAALKMLQDEQKIAHLKPYGEQIVETTEHLLSVLDDLRAVTKPESVLKGISTISQPQKEIEKALSSLEQLAQKAGVRIEIQGDEGTDISVQGNFQGMRQIVINLVKNALVHSGARNITLKLSRCGALNTKSLGFMLTVADDGKGIAPQLQSRLFEAFYRGDTDADGTGLGLHLSRDLARQLGGDLIYQSDVAEGASFLLTWQMALVDEQQQDIETKPLSLKGKRVLFAEDNLTIAMLTTAILKKLGAEVVAGNNGREAFERFQRDSFDLILTDIFMPQMDGYEFTQAVRNLDANIPIIGVTAATVGAEVDELLAMGASAVVSKPISVEKLSTALDSIRFR